jgi:hypothetical protein
MGSFLIIHRVGIRARRRTRRADAPAVRIRIALYALPVLALLACSPTPQSPELRLVGGWVRAMPEGASMSAAYGTLQWHGDEPLVIAEWHSDAHGDVSLHRTVERGGQIRMEAAPPAAILPGGSLSLQPGGLHLMLMQPGRELAPGDSVSITVISDSGRNFRFDLPVEAR